MFFNWKISASLRQYVTIIIVSFCTLFMGMEMAWMSPVLVKLNNSNETVLRRAVTEVEGAWLAAVSPLGGLPVIPIAGYLLDRAGRKWCVVLSCVPRLVQSLIYLFARDIWMLFLARILSGFSAALSMSVVTTYTSEIASKEIRGALGGIAQVLSAAGALVVLAVGPFVSYHTLNIVFSVILFVLILPQLFLPESPYFLYHKGHKDEALKTLTPFRSSEDAAALEIKEYSINGPTSFKIHMLKDKIVLKTIGKTVFLAIGLQLVGYNAVTPFLQTIFESTNTNLSPEVGSVVTGVIQLLACFCSFSLTDRFGRKPILIVTLLGMALGMFGLGLFFKVTENQQEVQGFLNALPLICLILVIFCNNAGIGSIVWMLIAELFDGAIRAVGVCFSVFFATLFIFFTIASFTTMIKALGVTTTYWFYSANCVVITLFVVFFIPETKGRTFSEIQQALGRKKVDCPD